MNSGKGNLRLSDTIPNLCLNHPNLQHANSCKLMSQEPLDCFLRPGRSICTSGSVWSSAMVWQKPGPNYFHIVKKYNSMGVSKNRGTPKSSILIGFSIIFTLHFGGKIPLFLVQRPHESDGLSCLRQQAPKHLGASDLNRYYQAKLNHILSPQKYLFAEANCPSHVAMRVNTVIYFYFVYIFKSEHS